MESENLTATKPQRKDVYFIDTRLIKAMDNFNIRIDYGDMDTLVESIRNNGVKVALQGFKVRGEDYYYVIDGHRRLRACQILNDQGISLKVPFIIESKSITDEQRILDMLTFNDGKPLNALEESEAINRLLNYHLSEKEICAKTGKSATMVSNLKLLGSAPANIKNLIRQDVISCSLAIKIMRESDDMNAAVMVFENAINYMKKKRIEADEKEMYNNLKKEGQSERDLDRDTEEESDDNSTMGNDNSVKPVVVKKEKITKEIIDKSNDVFNSIGAFKKFMKDYVEADIIAEKKDQFNFLKSVIEGKFSFANFEELFLYPKE